MTPNQKLRTSWKNDEAYAFERLRFWLKHRHMIGSSGEHARSRIKIWIEHIRWIRGLS